MHMSTMADDIPCLKCGASNRVREWPTNGDYVGWYCETQPQEYSVRVRCEKCGNEFFVVWDRDPGPVRPLDL